MQDVAGKIWACLKVVAMALLGLAIAALGVLGVVWMKRVIRGVMVPVGDPQNWWPVAGNPTMITMDAGGEIIRVDLTGMKGKDGKQVTSGDVTAVGVPYRGSEYAQVQIKHPVVDRRSVSHGVASNAINGSD